MVFPCGPSHKALAHGGRLREGPLDIADLGAEAILDDACGARVGVWQAKAFAGVSALTDGEETIAGIMDASGCRPGGCPVQARRLTERLREP